MIRGGAGSSLRTLCRGVWGFAEKVRGVRRLGPVLTAST
jgi:hypothetical protein